MPAPIILPPELEGFRAQLEATALDFIRVKAQGAGETQPWSSKVGGIPYMPKNQTLPCAPSGDPLFFLAQINFAEAPALKGYPGKGILQFFINDDDLYGMDPEDGASQETFRVLYHPDPVQDKSALQTDLDPDRDNEGLPHHPEISYPLVFETSSELVPACDFRFAKAMGPDFFLQFGDREWEVLDAYNRAVNAQGHKIGGYAYFTQEDPRSTDKPMLLLFQLDSDEGMDLMWGDMGVGHFFIQESALQNLDFSKVSFDWDCM